VATSLRLNHWLDYSSAGEFFEMGLRGLDFMATQLRQKILSKSLDLAAEICDFLRA
jgi:hypothetical protein